MRYIFLAVCFCILLVGIFIDPTASTMALIWSAFATFLVGWYPMTDAMDDFLKWCDKKRREQ